MPKSTSLELESTAKRKGYRVKWTDDESTALSWAESRKFDVVFLNASTPINFQRQLSEKIWSENQVALVYAYDLSDEGTADPKMRLYGAELAVGPDARQILEKTLETLKEDALSGFYDGNVLVVEDLDSPRDIICVFVEGLVRTPVVGVSSGSAALEALNSEPGKYSCIITDIRMPEMTGDELIRRIRRDEALKHIPVIVLTAFGTVDCLIDCLKAGASGFLVKPPKKNDMLREIERARRILSRGLSPRLVSAEEAESLKDYLSSVQ